MKQYKLYEFYEEANVFKEQVRKWNKALPEKYRITEKDIQTLRDGFCQGMMRMYDILKTEEVSPQDIPVYERPDNTTIEDIKRIEREIREKEEEAEEYKAYRKSWMDYYGMDCINKDI